MCGIVGIVQKNKTIIGQDITNALTKLEYRGYDSIGIATLNGETLDLLKDQGKISEVVEKVDLTGMKGKLGIGHTRWATHGPPTKENSHPHMDCDKKIAVVHNGIIENFQELKRELIVKGHKFKSETDTEIIPHLIEEFMKTENLNLKDASIKTIKKLEGTYAICIMSVYDKENIFCSKKDSPLVIGVNNDKMFIASDIPAFLNATQQVVLLGDDEFATVSADNYEIINLNTQKSVVRRPHAVSWKAEMAQKGGYPHFMLKEIHEQPKNILTYLKAKQDSVNKMAEAIHTAEKVIFIAAGTAYHSTLTGEWLTRKFTKKLSLSIIASEFDSIVDVIDRNTLIVPVSQSGETMDTIRAIKIAKEQEAKVHSVINVVGSSITRYSDNVVYLHTGPEIGVAATKTYLLQTTALWDVGLELGLKTGSIDRMEYSALREQFTNLPKAVSNIISKTEVKTKNIASWFATKGSSFYLGRGINVQTAKEGALKMKEISYIHCESYPAGESKHGPIALIENDYPVVFIAPKDETRKTIVGNIMEMKARGGTIVATMEQGDDELAELVKWPLELPKGSSEHFSTITHCIPLQLLSYYTAVRKGYNPDMPRNLAKSVTVL